MQRKQAVEGCLPRARHPAGLCTDVFPLGSHTFLRGPHTCGPRLQVSQYVPSSVKENISKPAVGEQNVQGGGSTHRLLSVHLELRVSPECSRLAFKFSPKLLDPAPPFPGWKCHCAQCRPVGAAATHTPRLAFQARRKVRPYSSSSTRDGAPVSSLFVKGLDLTVD